MCTRRVAGHTAAKGTSLVMEIVYGLTVGLVAGGLWKMHHWNNQKRTKQFYELLDKGEITIVVGEED